MKVPCRFLCLLIAACVSSAIAGHDASTLRPLSLGLMWSVGTPLIIEPGDFPLEITVIPMADPELRDATFFSIGGAGYGGRTTEAEHALARICATANATAKLMELLHSGSPAGQLYALLGLRVCDPVAYERVLPAFTSREDEVDVLMGCLGSSERVSVVALKIASGSFDQWRTR